MSPRPGRAQHLELLLPPSPAHGRQDAREILPPPPEAVPTLLPPPHSQAWGGRLCGGLTERLLLRTTLGLGWGAAGQPRAARLDAKSQDVGKAGCSGSLSFLGHRPNLCSGPSGQNQQRGRRWRRGPRASPQQVWVSAPRSRPHSAASSLSSVTGRGGGLEGKPPAPSPSPGAQGPRCREAPAPSQARFSAENLTRSAGFQLGGACPGRGAWGHAIGCPWASQM